MSAWDEERRRYWGAFEEMVCGLMCSSGTQVVSGSISHLARNESLSINCLSVEFLLQSNKVKWTRNPEGLEV